MRKTFNTTGLCLPDEHYMVDISEKVEDIKELVDSGKYFSVNRARQYGKTTTLYALKQKLEETYTVFSISFEGIGDAAYKDEAAFCRWICGLMYDAVYYGEVSGISLEAMDVYHRIAVGEKHDADLRILSNMISSLCRMSEKSVVFIIDEVDQASSQKIFLAFLGMLRDKYLKRKTRPTFQSVILAGVYDIKNLKLKIRENEEHQYNSPWNIAADFRVDMSFSISDIEKMLHLYEEDWHTGMNIRYVSEQIYMYTAGYPYLVSRLCQLLDEQVAGMAEFAGREEAWSENGIVKAVGILLREGNTLFDDMIKKLAEYPKLKDMLKDILFSGGRYSFERDNYLISLGEMFGFLKNKDGSVAIANIIYESKLSNLFISEEETSSLMYRAGGMDRYQFIKNGKLCMDLVMQKFCEHFTEIYADNDKAFVEAQGRKLFLLYLKPIINGSGNYYIEPETRTQTRADLVIDFGGERHVCEMKIWHGKAYNERGEAQLFEYLDYFKVDKGYLLSFSFNKNKQAGIKVIEYVGKTIMEVVV